MLRSAFSFFSCVWCVSWWKSDCMIPTWITFPIPSYLDDATNHHLLWSGRFFAAKDGRSRYGFDVQGLLDKAIEK